MPAPAPEGEHVWHLFVVRHPDRDLVRSRLASAGIDTLIHYPLPPHLQAAYGGFGLGRGALPESEALADQALSLPIGPHMTDEQVARVVEAVRSAVGGD